jgi:hypothetical protein
MRDSAPGLRTVVWGVLCFTVRKEDRMNKNRPVYEVRLGAIKASVWENTYEKTTRHNVTFCRVYKDGEQWKTTDSFGRDDLLMLAKVADRAHTWICDQRVAPVAAA